MRLNEWWKQFVERPHIHSYDKPIASMYISFNTRDIIYECSCGKRSSFRLYRPDSPFPIQTNTLLTIKEFRKILDGASVEDVCGYDPNK